MISLSKDQVIERLLHFRKIDLETNCWRTIGYTNPLGYGHITIENRVYELHRVSAYVFLGLDIDNPNEQANHKTTCTNHDCFNPDHLYVGNQSQNIQDSVNTKRHWESRRTHCPKGHEYTPENTRLDSRSDFHGRGKTRRCRICEAIKDRKKYLKRKERLIASNNNRT